MIALAVSLAACASGGSHYTLTHDGGYRLTLRAACPPFAVGCDLVQRRTAALPLLAQRLAERSAVQDAVVRADGASNLVVELPRVTNERDAASAVSALSGLGAVEFLDAGEQQLNVNESTAGRTCTAPAACTTGQYLVRFTGEQLDRASIAVVRDPVSSKPIVHFAFIASAQSNFAVYTRTHLGTYLTITAGDRVLVAAVIQSEIDGPAEIAAVTAQQARTLADDLWSGSLPIVLALVHEERVPPAA
jgi:preprotein translocase subunit SecD